MKTSSSSSAAGPAPTTSSPSFREMASKSSRFSGQSGVTRLTTPFRVPRASTAPSGTRATRDSPRCRVRKSFTLTPAARFGVGEASGRAGMSTTCTRWMRPEEVRAPISPRAVVGTTER